MSKIPNDLVATFSIVGRDPETGELGIAVQSKFLGVGAVVPWAEAGVGAVATQSMANTTYGPEGLQLLKEGKSAQEAMDILVEKDPDKAMRQAGIVDANGGVATFTGDGCYDWAGGKTGENYAAQGNILVSEETASAMAKGFEEKPGEPLAEKLLHALKEGQKAGGDSRGMQSAALFIVKEKGGYAGLNDRMVDLRVDDHETPINELERIYRLHQLYFTRPEAEDIMDIDAEKREKLVRRFTQLGYLHDATDVTDETFYKALRSYIHSENFEEREQEQGKIDYKLYQFILMEQ
ncbi:DUF1028 domain-containing protein [Alkalibacillus haloalkaliphilus]|uniref:Putative peptidoglycan binding domain-containing protein n=1 Tax=Alkalibacillus haloalkaliphilus TaxID=94136 RepID=A0A511W952_9BACI|nr:DUF1028 domain-containing protein [Alkalibacillus haloalkaliphilus]GEN46593.1 hypothetical protein AHA02nite_23690 [Alkalibacillus haloalkaliphilus]